MSHRVKPNVTNHKSRDDALQTAIKDFVLNSSTLYPFLVTKIIIPSSSHSKSLDSIVVIAGPDNSGIYTTAMGGQSHPLDINFLSPRSASIAIVGNMSKYSWKVWPTCFITNARQAS